MSEPNDTAEDQGADDPTILSPFNTGQSFIPPATDQSNYPASYSAASLPNGYVDPYASGYHDPYAGNVPTLPYAAAPVAYATSNQVVSAGKRGSWNSNRVILIVMFLVALVLVAIAGTILLLRINVQNTSMESASSTSTTTISEPADSENHDATQVDFPAPRNAWNLRQIQSENLDVSCELFGSYVGCTVKDRLGSDACDTATYLNMKLTSSARASSVDTTCGLSNAFLGQPGDKFSTLTSGSSTTYGDIACESNGPSNITCWNIYDGTFISMNPASPSGSIEGIK
ncbi:MAG: hypothetical protein SOS98_00950 [Varibaculum sp.]|nr:hypothetical protein [Varibaculum sp.]